MTLHSKLFLLTSVILLLLLGAHWLLVRSLVQELEAEAGTIALELSAALGETFERELGPRAFEWSAQRHARITAATTSFQATETTVWAGSGSGADAEALRRQLEELLNDEAGGAEEEGNRSPALALGTSPLQLEFDVDELIRQDDGRAVRIRILTSQGVASGDPGDRLPIFEEQLPVRTAGIEEAVASFQGRLLFGSLGVLGIGLVLAGLLAGSVSRPLRALASTAAAVGRGELGAQVSVRGEREVSQTIRAFNSMSSRLATLDAEAQRLREREHLGEIGEVARGLAHALRTPVHTLGLLAEELASIDDANERLEHLGNVRAHIQRVDRSLRAFLSLATGGGGAVEGTSVLAVIQDVSLELLQDPSRTVDLRIRRPERPPQLRAVLPELRAILQTVLENAIEASPEGGTVEVALRQAGDGVLVEVMDRGPGIPAEMQARLFTPNTTTKRHGSGLGLFLAHRIVRSSYGGTLELSNRSGGGTVARLQLRPREENRRAA